ncbi:MULTISPECIES: glycosyltransferase family 4 protein [unclassified Pseudoalteromonas]|jgi:glycosyltransferase involved in cell wall biosynthesis|uniref:Glycosyltransferase family 4 protein n=1 Tax=Pseudoalteromonas sp. SD03 TaxID=3231719 RepID=A0AB39ARW7_9GAMM|nr:MULTISPECIES: glycosyltransferase family 4 protein [unclassified Pseudoalteromonas]MDN3396835.1 glycosyltransferase family 4 protein [Pseudoalteromonas sp. APC 3215]MDN3407004.1 glycosyltransferase family 4 protein [Pseudoalteromonas sp. APC 3218]MDN3472716.1 glycosyltransferase family 4 protein [Pseudoalteromonas sp. APC 4026]SFT95315.1 Glycosyltransferase involved in cell wall bisynthesis [Pseudoalteromonas sp. DSM 26666]|tara:strand:+ start:1029 stop:2246 length:1218 start_codon:yes stop_codon:yes gene_type:complete
MNVLYFHQHFSTPNGSTGIRSYEMAQRLLKQGNQVTMVCGSYGGGETGLISDFIKGRREGIVDGIHIVEFDLAYSNTDGLVKRAGTFLKFAIKSISIALTYKYDVVFATTTPLTAGIPGIFARWLRGKPFVFEVRDLWPELPKEMGVIKNPLVLTAMSILEWCSYRSAHRCIGLSPGIVEGIKKRGVKASKVAIVPNGCDFTIFADDVAPWRPDGVEDTDLMAVFTGTHGLANGLDAALNAAKELKMRGRNDIKLVLVGQGKLKEDLQARAKRADLDNVIFHSPVNKSKLAELLKGADIGLQLLANIPAFYYGTSPNKFFDYISAGLPVLNNYPGWLAGMIKDNNCGYAIEPDNALAFADALENAADNKESLPAMGERAQALAKRDFNRHNLADKWVTWVTGAVK